MKLILVDEKYLRRWPSQAPARAKARCCGKAIRAGQWVFHDRLDALAYAQTDTHHHASCLKARLATVAEDTVEPTDPIAADRALTRRIEAMAAACPAR